jgi:cytochrome oxidase assembly protein ShyY1
MADLGRLDHRGLDASAFWAVARRPRWIAALLLCLGIAAGFAALGQWQLSRSVDNSQAQGPDTEETVSLDSIAEPQSAVTPDQFGRQVTVSGAFVTGDFIVVSDRNNGGSDQGSTVLGHFVTDDGVSLVVALGWTPDPEPGFGSFEQGQLTGRYLPSEAPSDSDFEAGERSAISVAELINIWPDAVPAYGGYLVLDQPADGLQQIYSPTPSQEISLNLLNIFYAIEWVVFAGFAIYLWYRLVRDVVERERDEATVE